ncbi:unnamed protein product [Acanthoscelides obtectus]|uniref:Uncharacterized protein n=1 Tax=Acanthoscelides obtectus TaxID=200917 RepID=A0A9P0PY31_ACAOB|nr:unnamed protein product [Acanthoscelides obtectus]CAK1670091.1 hypothetical protein AOBTE_LOCUS27392 [Acanthoscelides obtectus]
MVVTTSSIPRLAGRWQCKHADWEQVFAYLDELVGTRQNNVRCLAEKGRGDGPLDTAVKWFRWYQQQAVAPPPPQASSTSRHLRAQADRPRHLTSDNVRHIGIRVISCATLHNPRQMSQQQIARCATRTI